MKRKIFITVLAVILVLSAVIGGLHIKKLSSANAETPEDIMELAVVYIRIYFLSMLPMVFYNIGSGILRAFGNSRSPMNYQLIGGIANVAGLPWVASAILVLISMSLTFIAGLIPAKMAAKKDPVVALRSE